MVFICVNISRYNRCKLGHQLFIFLCSNINRNSLEINLLLKSLMYKSIFIVISHTKFIMHFLYKIPPKHGMYISYIKYYLLKIGDRKILSYRSNK